MWKLACDAQDGNLDFQPVETKPEEGYCSLGELKRNMDAFGEAIRGKRDSIDEAEAEKYPNLKEVDPNLVRSAFRDDKPSEPQESRDPFLRRGSRTRGTRRSRRDRQNQQTRQKKTQRN